MIEELIKIANAVTILAIMCFIAYIWSITKEMKYKPIPALIQAVFYHNNKPLHWLRHNLKYVYIYAVVPFLLFQNLILISQFYKGNYKIRLDYTFFISAIVWIFVLLLVKALYEETHKAKQDEAR